jgi:hypothetical protein
LTAKKTRKSLGDSLVNNFVYGDQAPIPAEETIAEQVEPIIKVEEIIVAQIEPIAQARHEAVVTAVTTEAIAAPVSAPISPQSTTSIMSRLMQTTPEKEATIRLTVDLAQSTHKKLSILCANNGMKKAEVVRMLLDDALKDTNI